MPPWLEAAYSHVPLPVSVTLDRRLVWVNPEFEHYYDCRMAEVRGKKMKDVVVDAGQLASQALDIRRLNDSLEDRGLGIRHIRNRSRGREVGVLVLAFSVPHRGRSFRVGIAMPDDLNGLLGLLARHLLTPGFDEDAFLGSLTDRQLQMMRDLSLPGATAKQAGGQRTRNGAGDVVRPIRTKLIKKGWLVNPSDFLTRDLGLLAMALQPRLQTYTRPPAGGPVGASSPRTPGRRDRRHRPRPR